jgi:hypothetical protein
MVEAVDSSQAVRRTWEQVSTRPRATFDEIEPVQPRQDVFHETQDRVRLVLILGGAFRLPVADGEFGDPDRLSIELVNRLQTLDQVLRYRSAGGMNADETLVVIFPPAI